MSRTAWLWVTAAPFALLSSAALAQTAPAPETPAQPPVEAAAPTNGVTPFTREFFAASSPATAYDMVQRVPGFTFDRGTVIRGLAGSGGNVLINGEPPVSKNDTLDEVLRRIPASGVVRLDLIQGGAPGIDMQGRTVILNVILSERAGFHGAVNGGTYFLWNGRHLTSVRAEGQWRFGGGRSAELAVVYGGGPSDESGDGPRIRTGPAGDTLIRSFVRGRGSGLRKWVTGAAETPLLGGRLRVNGAYMRTPFTGVLRDSIEFPTPGIETEQNDIDRLQAEIGARYVRQLTPRLSLEAVGFQQWNNIDSLTTFRGLTTSRDFFLRKNTTESVGRGVLRYRFSPTMTLEGGFEGAFNQLDSLTTLTVNSAPVVLPAANVTVQERRGEVFGTLTWRAMPSLTVEAGLRQEGSEVTSAGDLVMSRSLTFTKPRLVLTWAPTANSQIRGRFEREVGQLNFDDFVATSSVASTGSAIAGNPNLTPQQAWVSEVTFDQQFWRSADISLTLRHSALQDVVDRVPVVSSTGVVADAPGNLGDGTKDEVVFALSLPLERFHIPRARMRAQVTRRWSSVVDPLTGTSREISAVRPVEWEFHFSQDLPQWHSTWGMDVNHGSQERDSSGYRERFYRLSEVETRSADSWLLVWGEYHPRPPITLRVELMNATERSVLRQRDVYSGPRSTSPLLYRDLRDLQWGRVLNVRLRWAFG